MSGVPFPPVRPEDHGTMGDDGETRVCLHLKPVKRQKRENITGDLRFVTRLNEFVAALQKMQNDHYAEKFSNLTPPTVTVMNGIKNVRIVNVGEHQRTAYAFIEKETGNILKPAGWNAPAKHPRGNIYHENMLDGCNPYGVRYL